MSPLKHEPLKLNFPPFLGGVRPYNSGLGWNISLFIFFEILFILFSTGFKKKKGWSFDITTYLLQIIGIVIKQDSLPIPLYFTQHLENSFEMGVYK
jgi:hypothetical protein